MPARGAYEQHLGFVTVNQFVSHRERWDDVTAGASTGNEYAQLCHECSFHREVKREA
jgi:hypothetical protein